MRLARFITLVVVGLGLTVASAQANTITLNYDFSVTGFPTGAPVDPVTGSFSVTFDNTADLFDVTSGITVTGLNIPLDSAPAFTYLQTADLLRLGGVADGAIAPINGNDFVLAITNASTAPAITFMAYVSPGVAVATRVGPFTLTPTGAAPVPEPASLTLLGLGLAGIGAKRWRQRKA